jgi:hypothetical protein
MKGLDLNPFLQDQNKAQDAKYDLFGIISHRGSINGGHYVSYCKNIETNQWLEHDDSYFHPFTEKDVKNTQAYVLFYRLQGPNEASELVDFGVNDVHYLNAIIEILSVYF